MKILWIAMILAAEAAVPALAQEAPATAGQLSEPPVGTHPASVHAPSDQDTPSERQALNRYDEALRADALGKKLMAQQLVEEAIEASPYGRYASAARRLRDRLATETLLDEAPPADHALGSRIGYVISGGLLGAMTGALFAGIDSNASASLIAGTSLIGAAAGVGLTLLTAHSVTDGSMPAHLWSGGTYGAWASLGLGLTMLDSLSPGALAAVVGTGVAVGSIAGAIIGANTNLTAGDAIGGMVIGNAVLFEAILVEIAITLAQGLSPDDATLNLYGGTGLVAVTLGYVGGEILNRTLHWSGLRWGLVFLSSILGLGLGSLIGVVAEVGGGGIPLLIAAGGAIGFGVGCVATIGLSPDMPRGAGIRDIGRLDGRATNSGGFGWTF